MSEPEFDSNNKDAESMFDFLAEDGDGVPRRGKSVATPGDRPLPVIRKPVPVSESGPLRPPKPGAPVEPPPELTSSSENLEPDLDFLDDGPRGRSGAQQRSVVDVQDPARTNVTQLDPRSRRRAASEAGELTSGHAAGRSARTVGRKPRPEDDLDVLDLDDSLELDEHWHTGRGIRINADDESESRSGRGRWLALVLALVFIAAGIGSFIYSNPPAWLKLPGTVSPTITGDDNIGFDNVDPDVEISAPSDNEPAVAFSPSPLMQKFLAEQERLEQLVAAGSLDEAEAALQSMDRTVYGYGATEFAALEDRIDQMRAGTITPEQVITADGASTAEAQSAREEAARLAEEQAAREEAARLAEEQAAREEAARLAEEQSAREEAARLAEEQAAREEAARLAEEQAAREEAARLAEEQAAREEAARLAEEQSAREEATRRAEEQAARIEQIRLAEREARAEADRLALSRSEADAAATAAPSGSGTIDRDRIATDRRIAEERAALQRQQARERRLIEAREREAQAEQARASVQSGETDDTELSGQQDRPTEIATASQETETVATASNVISDADLQMVYQRFVDLQRAISQRDINTVVSLTQRSGVRVQQFMQIFENSSEIDARIKNVSTSNATGEIKGTLQINRIRRPNGNYVKPPASLSSIALSSKRDDNGWSAIAW